MSYINYKNVYTIYDDLSYNLFIDDLHDFQNLISNNNYNNKSIYRNELIDISFIQFNNSNKENVINLNSGNIYNIGTAKVDVRKYKYFRIDFKRFITLNDVTLYNESKAIIPYILWTKSKELTDSNAIYDTSSELIETTSLIHVKDVVFQIKNYENFPNYLYYKPIKTDKIFYYPIETDVSFINYYAFSTNYENFYLEGVKGFLEGIIDGSSSYYLNNRTPSISETTNIINNIGPFLYGDAFDNFYSIENMNNYLYNNTKIEFDRAFFDINAITQIDNSYNYAISFFYRSNIGSRYDTSNIYIDLSSDLFRLFNLSDISSDNIKNININDQFIPVLDLSINTEISFNFIYNPYKEAELSISDTLNSDYLIIGKTINTIIDKYPTSSTIDLSNEESVKYMIPIIFYNDKYVLVKDNTYSKLITNNSSSTYLNSNNLNVNNMFSNDISSDTVTNENSYINNLNNNNNLNTYDIKINNVIDASNTQLNYINSINNSRFTGNFNLLHNVDFNINYPYKINTHKDNTYIFKIYNNDFINYYNEYLEINKNIYIDKLTFNNIYSHNTIYNLESTDIAFNKNNINNIICNRTLIVNEVIKINNNFTVDLANSNTGYMMQIYSCKTGLYDSGWNIDLNTRNGLVDRSYIRFYPLESNSNDNTYSSIFEIESYYLKHSSTLNWIKNIDYSNISDIQYLSSIVYKDASNFLILKNFDNIPTKISDTDYYPNLNIVNKLKPKLFYRSNNLNKIHSGFIAQDLQEINDLSFLVYSNYSNYKLEEEKLYINYEGLQPYIIASLQELYFVLEKINEWHHNNI